MELDDKQNMDKYNNDAQSVNMTNIELASNDCKGSDGYRKRQYESQKMKLRKLIFANYSYM